jgi:hypothetical protein
LALAWYRYGQLARLNTLQVLLTQSARIRHHGTLVGGRLRAQGERNPLLPE